MKPEFSLSPRLAAVADWVPEGAALADIGTDHAYLPAWLLINGRISHAIGADVREYPVRRARQTAEYYGLTDRLDVRQCDGLSGISPEECSVVTIAGMGGETIAGILSRTPWSREKRLILEPQSTQAFLRRFLAGNGFCIRAERAVREGERWYPVLLAESGEMSELSPGEALAGRRSSWVDEPERREYLLWLLRMTERRLDGIGRAVSSPDAVRRSEWEACVRYLRESLLPLRHLETNR